ncbi:MAG: hypothetical protein M3O02_05890 [Acidobacteriota bacterium]|nr:hypothetical protein [Acidobacteriota bacterium]
MLVALGLCCAGAYAQPKRHTSLSIRGADFLINGTLTYPGRTWHGHRIEGLLFNARMVNGIFDDLNPETRSRWVYPDTHTWDPERNTREFLAAMPDWRAHGLLGFTINLQGGSPEGYSHAQPWINSAFTPDGSLRPEYMARLARILDRADELGMVAIVGLFYQAQDRQLTSEAAVTHAVDNAAHWLLDRGYTNLLVEINNECEQHYVNPILQPERVHELITRVRGITRKGRRLLVATSYGHAHPGAKVVEAEDVILVHGNGVKPPESLGEQVRAIRRMPGGADKPVVFNEDDHTAFDEPVNNLTVAVSEHASWGFFDYRRKGEPFAEGFQSVPGDWRIGSDRKRAFFNMVSEITGEGSSAGATETTK